MPDHVSQHAAAVIDQRLTQIADLAAEILAARGGRSVLANRLDTISNFASPNSGGTMAGRYYDQAFHAGSTAAVAQVAGRLDLSPFYTSQPFRFNQIGVFVTTASVIADAQARIAIYEAGPDQWPSDLVFESALFPITAGGFAGADADFTFDSGRQYWMGLNCGGAVTVQTIPTAALTNLGLMSSTHAGATTYCTLLRRSIAIGAAMPTQWGAVSSGQLQSSTVASIRMRAA